MRGFHPQPRVTFSPLRDGAAFVDIPGPRPSFEAGAPAPTPGVLFARAKSNQKHASLRLERFIYVLFEGATAQSGLAYR